MATNSQCQSAAKVLMSKFGREGVISEEDAIKIIQECCGVPVVKRVRIRTRKLVEPVKEKKKRGPKPGSKNKKKKIVEPVIKVEKKRGPGRPRKVVEPDIKEVKKRGPKPGSKNRKTQIKAATIIQKYARRYTVEYQVLLKCHTVD